MADDVGMSLWDQWRLYREFSPLLGYGERIVSEKDPYKQALIVADACEWLAAKSQTRTDDQFLKIVSTLVRTPEGEQLIRWAIAKAKELDQ